MKGNSKCGAIHKHKFCVVLKLGVTFLATALALRVFLYNSTGFPPQSLPSHQTPSSSTPISETPHTSSLSETVASSFDNSSDPSPNTSRDKVNAVNCDLFAGDWIPNPGGPAYTNESCDIIEEHQNCMKNGRPDSEYLYWKWKPRHCELPQFNAERFLEMMRDKSWALIGDSISRNHVQSLLCMLSKVEKPAMFYHDEGYKSKGWHFRTYNLTVYSLWSPFLTEAAIFEDINGVSNREIELQLDKLDKKWTDLFDKMDYMIFSTGKWFVKAAIYYENNTTLGCHHCRNSNLTELDFEFAYHRCLKTALNFIARSGHKGLIFFRTSTPDHFEDREWFSGGRCNRTTPFKEGEIEMKDFHKSLRTIELEEFENAISNASQNGVKLKLLDFVQLSLLRPDGHPGPYRHFYPFAKDKNAEVQNDCLHWCLPGPIDSWNDVIMQMVVNG